MFTRRGARGGRGNRRGVGLGGGGPNAFGALAHVAPTKVLQYVRADAGITKDGSNRISVWSDQSAAGKHYTQGTGANQPLFSATGGPNSRPMVSIDDTARFLSSTLVTPAPGTTPTCIYLVGRYPVSSVGKAWLSDTTRTKRSLYQQNASPSVTMYDGVSVNNAGMAANTWGRVLALFSASTSDRIKARSTNVTGASAGNQAADTGRTLGINLASAAMLFDFAEVLYLNAAPSAAEEAALDAYVTAWYGPGLV